MLNKFKVTIIEQSTGLVVSETLESNVFPYVGFPQHSLRSGEYGMPVKIELVLDAPEYKLGLMNY